MCPMQVTTSFCSKWSTYSQALHKWVCHHTQLYTDSHLRSHYILVLPCDHSAIIIESSAWCRGFQGVHCVYFYLNLLTQLQQLCYLWERKGGNEEQMTLMVQVQMWAWAQSLAWGQEHEHVCGDVYRPGHAYEHGVQTWTLAWVWGCDHTCTGRRGCEHEGGSWGMGVDMGRAWDIIIA